MLLTLCCLFFLTVAFIEMIDEGKDLRHHLIDRIGNLVPELKLRKHLHQVRVIVNGYIVFPGKLDNPVGNEALSFGSNLRSVMFGRLIRKCYRLPFNRFFLFAPAAAALMAEPFVSLFHYLHQASGPNINKLHLQQGKAFRRSRFFTTGFFHRA